MMEQFVVGFITNSPTAGAIILVVWMMLKHIERSQEAYLSLVRDELHRNTKAITDLVAVVRGQQTERKGDE